MTEKEHDDFLRIARQLMVVGLNELVESAKCAPFLCDSRSVDTVIIDGHSYDVRVTLLKVPNGSL